MRREYRCSGAPRDLDDRTGEVRSAGPDSQSQHRDVRRIDSPGISASKDRLVSRRNLESGADVDDRVAAFLDGLEVRLHKDETHPKTVLIVSHGLTIRLLCRRLFDWSIELFESLSNVDTCENRVLDHDGTGWKLDRPFDQWRDSPDGTVQQS